MGGRPHFVVVSNDARDVVEIWSSERLPYEPRGWLLEMRNALRVSLREMHARDGDMLAGVYGSHIDDYCDVENVLIYNVGASNFSATAAMGLRLERGHVCPDAPVELDGGAHHYARGATAAEWSGVPMQALSEATKPSLVWHAMRTAPITASDRANASAPFGVELVVGVPDGERMHPAKLIKPLVDGVIAGLHTHDGSALPDVIEHLCMRLLGARPSEVEVLLVEERAAPLGRRRLLWPWGNGVQWNPADDLCVALELRVERAARRELAGRLFEIERLAGSD